LWANSTGDDEDHKPVFDEHGFSATANPEYRSGQLNPPIVKGSVDDDNFWNKMEELERRSGVLNTTKSAPFKPPTRVSVKVRVSAVFSIEFSALNEHQSAAPSPSGFQTAATLLKGQKTAQATGLTIGSAVSHKFKTTVNSAPSTDVTFKSARDLMQAERKGSSKQTPISKSDAQSRTLDSFGFVKRATESSGSAVKRAHEVIDIDDDNEPPLKRVKTSHETPTHVELSASNSGSFRSISGKFSNKL